MGRGQLQPARPCFPHTWPTGRCLALGGGSPCPLERGGLGRGKGHLPHGPWAFGVLSRAESLVPRGESWQLCPASAPTAPTFSAGGARASPRPLALSGPASALSGALQEGGSCAWANTFPARLRAPWRGGKPWPGSVGTRRPLGTARQGLLPPVPPGTVRRREPRSAAPGRPAAWPAPARPHSQPVFFHWGNKNARKGRRSSLGPAPAALCSAERGSGGGGSR